MSFESESDRVYSFSQSDQRSRGNWGRGVWACLVILSILIAISHAFLALVAFHLLSSNSDYKYSPDNDVFLVALGSSEPGRTIEILGRDSEDEGKTVPRLCGNRWPNLPDDFRQFGAIGSVLGRGESNLSVYVCGHKEEAEDALICMKLDRRSDSWIDTGFRGEVGPYSAAVKIDGEDDVLWITGGRLPHGQISSRSSYFHPQMGFQDGPELPGPRHGHCLVKIGRNRYLLAGGKPQARDTYVYDFHLRTWFDAGLLSESREGAACGAVDMKSGGEGGASVQVVVAGGHGLSGSPLSTVEVFDSRTFRWTQGRKLDHGFYYAAGLPTHGNSKLLVVGGNSGNGDSYRRDIIEYDPESDAWIRVGQLEQSRAYSVAIPLSRAWCDDGL